MFRSYIDQAKLTISAVVAKSVGQGVVALLLLIAAGFGVAAVATILSERFGPVTAYALLAGVFAVIAFVAYLLVAANDRHQQALMHRAAAQRGAMASTFATAAPLALAQSTRLLGTRAAPIIIAAVVLGGLFYRNYGRSRDPRERY